MFQIVAAAGPGIVVNAPEIGDVEQSREVVCEQIGDPGPSFLRENIDCLDPIRTSLGRFLLEEKLFLGSIGITLQDHRAVFQERQDMRRDAEVVEQYIALAKIWPLEVDLVEVRQRKRL